MNGLYTFPPLILLIFYTPPGVAIGALLRTLHQDTTHLRPGGPFAADQLHPAFSPLLLKFRASPLARRISPPSGPHKIFGHL